MQHRMQIDFRFAGMRASEYASKTCRIGHSRRVLYIFKSCMERIFIMNQSVEKNGRTGNRAAQIRKMTALAVFCALAYISVFVFRLHVSFLTFDIKDAIITIAAMFYGPVSALLLSALVAVLEFLSVSDTGVYGLIMNFVSSASFSFVAAGIYKYRRTMSGAFLSLTCAVFSMTGVMLVANLLITPHFMGASVSQVRSMIPTLLLPFNLTKALLNAGIVLLLYKRLSEVLRRLGGKAVSAVKPSRPYLVPVIALAVIAISVCVFCLVLGGSAEIPFLSFFK